MTTNGRRLRCRYDIIFFNLPKNVAGQHQLTLCKAKRHPLKASGGWRRLALHGARYFLRFFTCLKTIPMHGGICLQSNEAYVKSHPSQASPASGTDRYSRPFNSTFPLDNILLFILLKYCKCSSAPICGTSALN